MPHESFRDVLNVVVGLVMSFFGIAALVANSPPMSMRQQVVALICGASFGGLVPLLAVKVLQAFGQLPPLDEVAVLLLIGALGFLSGAMGIKVFAAFMAAGDRLPGVAAKAVDRIGGGGEQ